MRLSRSRTTQNSVIKLISPANSALAIRWTFGDREGLSNLGLSEPKTQSTKLESLGELLDVLQIDAVDNVAG